ncbi:hypothetical protein SLA2020_226880 [Shorea laevis]
MEVAAGAASTFALHSRMLSPYASARTANPSPRLKASFTTTGSGSGEFSGHTIRSEPLTSQSIFPPQVQTKTKFRNQCSSIYKRKCMGATSTRLSIILYEDEEKPIYMYINSTETQKGGQKLGYETEALTVYDAMSYVKAPIFTLCIGNAWGEAALLLTSGTKGNHPALPSCTIMIRQPIARLQGQATDVGLARKELRNVKTELINLLAKHTGKSPEQIEDDFRHPKYFTPSEAVEYGIIDKILKLEREHKDRGVVCNLKKAQLL